MYGVMPVPVLLIPRTSFYYRAMLERGIATESRLSVRLTMTLRYRECFCQTSAKSILIIASYRLPGACYHGQRDSAVF